MAAVAVIIPLLMPGVPPAPGRHEETVLPPVERTDRPRADHTDPPDR
ncbi:hypothetical protein [Streptomyces europaeiscabiei]|nr:hypothetical protein OHB30_10470 [Streptomyces europaeiscabiei]